MKNWAEKCLNSLVYGRIKRRCHALVEKFPRERLTSKEKEHAKALWKMYGISGDVDWLEVYKYYNGDVDAYSITPDMWKYMEQSLNPSKYRMMQHKGLLHHFIDTRYLPDTIVNKIDGTLLDEKDNILTEKEAVGRLISSEKFVMKPTIHTGGGRGVELMELTDLNPKEQQDKVCQLLREGNNFICQKPIVCHERFTRFNKYPKTVNSIRCFTLNLNGKMSIIGSYLRMSNVNLIKDNMSLKTIENTSNETSSCYAGIKKDGTLTDFAINMRDYAKTDTSPSGIVLQGERLDFYDRLKAAAIEIHSKLPVLKFIAFDITMDADGNARVIEINLDSQDIEDHHIFNGAVFKDRYDELLNYVKNNPPEWVKL